MNIYVYWNTNDNDCKKIFHFMSKNDEYSVVECLEENNALKVERIWQPFKDKSRMLKDIYGNDLIIFLTHGAEDCILKYRNDPNKDFADYILLDKNDAYVLRDKVVLAFCCSSAKELGRYCVTPGIGCKAYVGFERSIVYDNGKAEKSRHLIYESYKIAFMRSLKYAVNSNCSIAEYQIRLTQLLRQESTRAILMSGDHTLHNMYSGTIEGLVALGDQQIKIFC